MRPPRINSVALAQALAPVVTLLAQTLAEAAVKEAMAIGVGPDPSAELSPRAVARMKKCGIGKVWAAMERGSLEFQARIGRGGKPCRHIKHAHAMRWNPREETRA